MGRVGWSVVLILVAGAFVVRAAEKTTAKGSSKTTETASAPKTKIFSEMMETVDYVRSGAMVVGFLAVNFAGRDTWMLAEILTTFASGIAICFFPDAILDYQTDGKLDAVHLFLYQSFGAMLISIAVTTYVSRESRDRSVSGSLLLSRVLGGAVLLQAAVIDHMKAAGDKQRFNQAHWTFGVLAIGLWVVGSLWHYLRSPSYGSGGVDLSQRLTKHLLIDLLLCLPMGLADFAFPDFFLSTITMKGFVPDGIHAHLDRSIGALFFMTSLHCHSAMGFSDDIDKRAHLLGRIVSIGMYIVLLGLYQYKYTFSTMTWFCVGLGMVGFIILNPLCAYFIRGKAKRI